MTKNNKKIMGIVEGANAPFFMPKFSHVPAPEIPGVAL